MPTKRNRDRVAGATPSGSAIPNQRQRGTPQRSRHLGDLRVVDAQDLDASRTQLVANPVAAFRYDHSSWSDGEDIHLDSASFVAGDVNQVEMLIKPAKLSPPEYTGMD